MAWQRAYDPMPEDDDDLEDQYSEGQSPRVDPSSTGATGDAKRITHKHRKNQRSVNY